MDLTLLKDKCYLCLSDTTLLSSFHTGSFKCQMKLAFNTQLLDDPRLPQQMCEDCIDSLQQSFKINNKLIKASLIYKKLLKEDDIRKNGNIILVDDDENANRSENIISKVKTNEVACQTDEVLTTTKPRGVIQADRSLEIDPKDFVAVADTVEPLPMNNCPICGKTLQSLQGVYIHLKTHYKTLPIVCRVCNLEQSKMSNMVLHLRNSECRRKHPLN